MAQDPSALAYPVGAIPAPGKTVVAAPGVRWLRMPLPFALDHINLWLIEDGDGWTAVDTGYGIDATKSLWREIFATGLEGRPIRRIVVTHYHPDHFGLAAWLEMETGAPVHMTREEFATGRAVREQTGAWSPARVIEHLTRHGLAKDQLRAQETRGNSYRRGVPVVPESILPMADGDVLSIGGRAWQVRVVRGHAPEHAMLWCEETRTLISGDQMLPRISTNVSVWAADAEGDPLAQFLRSIADMRALPADTRVLPSHGAVFEGLHTRIGQLEEHHRERLLTVEAALDAPRSAAEMIPVLFQRALDDHQLGFAIGESIAHLNHLMYAGRVERYADPDGILRFRRPA